MRLLLIGSALVVTVGMCQAQPASPARPEFEVASIKPYKLDPRDRPQLKCSGDRLASPGVPLKYVIEWAYDIRTQFSVPDWADEAGERYAIEAKAAGPIVIAQCRLMTQSLLEDRFNLKLRRESKEMAVYALVVGKGGSKLREANADGPPGDGVWLQGRKVSGKGWEPWMLAAILGEIPQVGRPVVDQTGLKGLFEFRLEYWFQPNDDRPDIFRAIDQLGLKLEPSRGMVEFVVIDHLEKPSGN